MKYAIVFFVFMVASVANAAEHGRGQASSEAAAVYRCTGPEGKVMYASAPRTGCVVAFTYATAKAKAGLSTVFGLGQASCGSYLQNRSQWQRPGVSDAYTHWLAGFASGVSAQRGREIATDFPGMEEWIKQYCGKDPTIPLISAAWAFFQETGK
mgnify:CR=1 FL=1